MQIVGCLLDDGGGVEGADVAVEDAVVPVAERERGREGGREGVRECCL